MLVRGEMTVVEAARKGGNATLKKMGVEFYRENGRKSARTIKKRYGNAFYGHMARCRGAIARKIIQKAIAEKGEIEKYHA